MSVDTHAFLRTHTPGDQVGALWQNTVYGKFCTLHTLHNPYYQTTHEINKTSLVKVNLGRSPLCTVYVCCS